MDARSDTMLMAGRRSATLVGAALVVAAFGSLPAAAQDLEVIDRDLTGPAAVKLGILLAVFVVVGFGAWRLNVGQALKNLLTWGALFAALLVIYAYRADLTSVGREVASVLVPGMVVPTTGDAVTVRRAFHGQFVLNGAVDNAPVSFLFDTGASLVVLAAADAERAGFDPSQLDYRVPVMTAGGMTTVAPVRLPTVSVGGITMADVRAAIARPGDLEASLLGMSFLNRLDGYEVRRDRLVLIP
ncbi:retropepsin-like aspartic protease family protein [Acuticoccus sp.]|uniref:retropepsin-like aspartic protease family protein n=1 Tax=Acuticoccus sp. TaxID=1904378 RepID=UPI003B520558